MAQRQYAPRRPDHGVHANDPHYSMFILGSGGHTTEMLRMIELSVKEYQQMHRRYVVTSGDNHSLHRATVLEDNLTEKFASKNLNKGTWDAVHISRARKVHQSFWTTPFTSLLCLFDIFVMLMSQPEERQLSAFNYPGVIVTNGPGSGFLVCAMAFILKMAGVVPVDRMRVVFVESFTKVDSLSLTGKLFHWTNIADTFVVQHEPVAQRYNKVNAGYLVTLGRVEELVLT